jgi:hypothetical protein
VVVEVQLLAQQQAPRYELTEAIGTVIMVIGAGIIFIIGITVDAGSGLQVEDHIRYRVGIAAEHSDVTSRALSGRSPAPP